MAFAMSPPAAALNPWLQILAALEKKVIRQSFETWLKPTRYSHSAGRTLCLHRSSSTLARSTAT
jgi:chromosomal replication initiator protein